ncbi:Zinc finger CCHC domain-containing protein 8 [Nymphon striatum]|nr:Zinc finger CCHC domain-containing protein 8 [Nymphon striatum]
MTAIRTDYLVQIVSDTIPELRMSIKWLPNYKVRIIRRLGTMDFVVIDQASASENSDSDMLELPMNAETNCNCHIKIKKLEAKVKDLKKRVTSFEADKCKPPVQIIFSDQTYARRYQDQVETFLQDLLSNKYGQTPEINEKIDDKEKSSSQSLLFFKGFCVDKRDSASKQSPLKMSSSSCFNCLGDHMIKDCPHPINRANIAKNKSSRTAAPSSSRYHLDESSSGKFQPGVLSEDLMHALDLGQREIPSFIYKMRILGYPPGWLKEAEIQDSSLKLYNSQNDHQSDDSDVDVGVQYNLQKLIDYPGFNVQPGPNVIDNYEKHGYPEMQPFHLKKNMIQRLECNSQPKKKKKKHKEENSPKRKKIDHSTVDMDIADETDKIERATFKSPNPKQNKKEKIQDSDSSRCSSPSLSELENVRKKLLNQLNDNSEIANSTSQDSPDSNVESISLPTGRSIIVESGSPSIGSKSGVDKLPEIGKFSDGIGEHLPFENLQDSIGTFDRMKGVLGKVRQKLKMR